MINPGSESYEHYYSEMQHRFMIEYSFCAADGELFFCIAPSLEAARGKRDQWMEKREEKR
jgi:hypothetical protein